MGAGDTVGSLVGMGVVGCGLKVGSVLAGKIFTSAQLKNCSGQVVPRVPSLG